MMVFGITNRKLCEDFYIQISKISTSRLDYLILREKDLPEEELLQLALEVKNRLKQTDIKLIINSNIDVAKAIKADGIQLSYNKFLELKHRPFKKVGVSIHSYNEAIEAYKLGADYVIYGHVFETECKKGLKPRGVIELSKIAKDIDIPVIGLGGIDHCNYKEVLQAGAEGIAVMSSLMNAQDVSEFVEKFLI